MEELNVKIVHEGRGGYIEYDGCIYNIEHVDEGHFCIHFPSGNKHNKMQQHLDALNIFAASQKPEWYIDNRLRKYS